MFALPDAKAFLVDPNLLPKLPVQIGIVHYPTEHEHRYHHQAQITWHNGLFFCMWIEHPYREDQPGQMVEYATSRDGLSWSKPDVLAPAVSMGYELGVRHSGGFWNRGNELFAVSAQYMYEQDNISDFPQCKSDFFAWDGRQWRHAGVQLDDFHGFEGPRLLAGGEYLLAGHNQTAQLTMLIGGRDSLSAWKRVRIPPPADGHNLLEPNCWQDRKGIIHVFIRDDSNSHRLYYTASTDGGKTFPAPIQSEIPDARSRVSTGILSDGRIFLCGNSRIDVPTDKPRHIHPLGEGFGRRIPLTIAIGSDDGRFEKVYSIRNDDTSPRWDSSIPSNGWGGAYGYQYPNVLEHDGFLYIAHSVNKEDIVVARVSVCDL